MKKCIFFMSCLWTIFVIIYLFEGEIGRTIAPYLDNQLSTFDVEFYSIVTVNALLGIGCFVAKLTVNLFEKFYLEEDVIVIAIAASVISTQFTIKDDLIKNYCMISFMWSVYYTILILVFKLFFSFIKKWGSG